MICASGESKSRPVKAAGAKSCGQRRNQKLNAAVAAKHILKSKCTKHVSFGALFEVLKNCTPLWRKSHFEVRSFGALFEVLMLKNCTQLPRKNTF